MKTYRRFVEDTAAVPTNTTAGIPQSTTVSVNNKYKRDNKKRVLRYAFITRGVTKSSTTN
jgi:hypothetical protein